MEDAAANNPLLNFFKTSYSSPVKTIARTEFLSLRQLCAKRRVMEYVPLRSFDNYIEANIVLNMLRHYNINCHLKDENIITIDPLLSPALGGMKLMVHEAHVARAWDLMDDAEAAYLKTIPCPVCKKHALTAVSITKQHKCKLGALASMLLNGQSVELTKIYKCTACGYDFKELPA